MVHFADSMSRHPPLSSFFFFNDTATTEIYTLSLHDALPILGQAAVKAAINGESGKLITLVRGDGDNYTCETGLTPLTEDRKSTRLNSSHQIISYAVFCLKKKKTNNKTYAHTTVSNPDDYTHS